MVARPPVPPRTVLIAVGIDIAGIVAVVVVGDVAVVSFVDVPAFTFTLDSGFFLVQFGNLYNFKLVSGTPELLQFFFHT